MIDLFENLTLGVLQEASSMGWLQLLNVQDAFRTVRERMGKEMLLHRYVEGAAMTPSCFRELQVRGMPHWCEESLSAIRQPMMPPPCCCVSNSCSDGLSRQIKSVLGDGAARSKDEEDFHRALAKLFPNASEQKLRWDRALALFVVDTAGSAVCYQNPRRKRVLGVLEHCSSCGFGRRGKDRPMGQPRPTTTATTPPTTTTTSPWMNGTPKRGRPAGCSAACRAWQRRRRAEKNGPSFSPRPKTCTLTCRRRQARAKADQCIARGKRHYLNLLKQRQQRPSPSPAASSSQTPPVPSQTYVEGQPLVTPTNPPGLASKQFPWNDRKGACRTLLFEKC